jgi:hypothetical protein
MKKIVLGFALLSITVGDASYTVKFGDVQFNLKSDQKVIVTQPTFITLRKYSKTIDDAATEAEKTTAIKELPFDSVEKNDFKFIVDSLKIIESPGKLIIKLQNYLRAHGVDRFKQLMQVIQFFDIQPLLSAYESLPQLQQACPVTSKRKKPESEKEKPKKLKLEAEPFITMMPAGKKGRERILKILNASVVLKNYIRETRSIENMDELAPGAELVFSGINIDQWNLLLDLADQIEDFSNDMQVHSILKSFSAEKLKDTIIVADYLELEQILKNSIDLLLGKIENHEMVYDVLQHFDAYEQFFNQIPPAIREILKKKIINSTLFKDLHWKGSVPFYVQQPIIGIALSPDGKIIAAGVDKKIDQETKKVLPGGIILIDIAKNKITFLANLDDAPDIIKFSPDGRYLTSSSLIQTQKILVINLEKAESDVIVANSSLRLYAFSNDSKMIGFIATDGALTFYDLINHSQTRIADASKISGFNITALTFSPNDEVIAFGLTNGQILLFDIKTGKEIKRLYAKDPKRINALAFFDENRLVVKTEDMKMRLWDIKNEKIIGDLSLEYVGEIWQTDPIMSTDGTTIAADFKTEIRVWHLPEIERYQSIPVSGENWFRLRGVSTVADWLSFDKNGTRLAMIAGDNGVFVWTNVNDQLNKLPFGEILVLAMIKKYQALSDKEKSAIVLSEAFQNKISALPIDIKAIIVKNYPKILTG